MSLVWGYSGHGDDDLSAKLAAARKYVAGVHARGFRYRSEPVVLTEWKRERQAVKFLRQIRRFG